MPCSNYQWKPTRTTQITKHYYYKLTVVNQAKVRRLVLNTGWICTCLNIDFRSFVTNKKGTDCRFKCLKCKVFSQKLEGLDVNRDHLLMNTFGTNGIVRRSIQWSLIRDVLLCHVTNQAMISGNIKGESLERGPLTSVLLKYNWKPVLVYFCTINNFGITWCPMSNLDPGAKLVENHQV